MQNISHQKEQQHELSEAFVIIHSVDEDIILESIDTIDHKESDATIHASSAPQTINEMIHPNEQEQAPPKPKFNFINTCLASLSISSLIILLRTILKPEPKYEQGYLHFIGITGGIMGLSFFAKYRFQRDSSPESTHQRPHHQ
jgi:hypothetical protein